MGTGTFPYSTGKRNSLTAFLISLLGKGTCETKERSNPGNYRIPTAPSKNSEFDRRRLMSSQPLDPRMAKGCNEDGPKVSVVNGLTVDIVDEVIQGWVPLYGSKATKERCSNPDRDFMISFPMQE
ncbi:hypothetical protein OS493_036281 [Desmophyllum pertusum]|uniref:Uncharacterized protein n=1 Tax=Desmophyllum pertusum TaxID=174260 RepID=A0A9W9ZIE9_9CNID|nr:hypothetical protein OS493_036281 [Desmophyllum pertusum]